MKRKPWLSSEDYFDAITAVTVVWRHHLAPIFYQRSLGTL